jgi:hypothetical protein
MGWSCSVAASNTERTWQTKCIASTNSQNTWREGPKAYFYEASRVEHYDGAITGSIYQMDSAGMARKTSSFRINGDGSVAKAPTFLKTGHA